MKLITTLICLICTCASGLTQNNCNSFYPSEEGLNLVIHQLDKRERLSNILDYTVTETNTSGFTMNSIVKDKRGREIVATSFKVICDNGTTRLDPTSILMAQLQQYDGMEYSITGDDILYPNNLTVGQSLPDASVTMKVDAGVMNITTTITMSNRKVASQESVTTPAGTFECYLITYTNTLNMGALNKTFNSKQWISRGVGMVKEETRKRNGNLMTKSVLHAIN